MTEEKVEDVNKALEITKKMPVVIFFLVWAFFNFYSLMILVTNFLNNTAMQGFVVVAINTLVSYAIFKQVKA
jgi:hypothetical protein